MPTESNEKNLVKLLYKDKDGVVRELCNYEHKEENNDDAVDALEYAVKGMLEEQQKAEQIIYEHYISKQNNRLNVRNVNNTNTQ